MAVDYAAYQNAQNPLQMAMKGFSDGGGIRQAQQQQQIGQQTIDLNQQKIEAYKQAQGKQQAYQQRSAEFNRRPNKTAQDYFDFQVANPQVKDSFDGVIENMNAEQLRSRVSQATQIVSAIEMNQPEIVKDLMEKYGLAAENSGDTAFSDSIKALGQMYDASPETVGTSLNNFLAAADPENFADIYENIRSNAKVPAETQAFNELIEGMSPEDKMRAKRVKAGLDARAVENADITLSKLGDQGAVDQVALVVGTLTAAEERAKLNVQLDMTPQIRARVDEAVGMAKAVLAQDKGKRDNGKALKAYEAGISSLSTALGNTYTGLGGDLISGLTVDGQIANASVALMAPILKDIFRGAGEGTFTKDDQEILLRMLPTANMKSGAREAALKQLDMVVRAKLSVPSVIGGPDNSGLPTISSQEEYDNLNSGDEYIDSETGRPGTKP
tara:strand:+ start:1689 stop:3014 length:1326 start_codon:yes stop_codon:yes gene_type:complete